MAEYRRLADGTATADGTRKAQGTDKGLLDLKSSREEDPLLREIRGTDLEPYTGLRYLSKLFRFMAVILVLLLVAEVVTGLYTQGSASLPTLLGEASRLVVLAGVLWGTGDFAHLLIDAGHDVRAARILVARIAHNAKVGALPTANASVERPVERVAPRRGLADLHDHEGP